MVEKHNFLQPQFRDPGAFACSAYGRCLRRNEAHRQEFKVEGWTHRLTFRTASSAAKTWMDQLR